MYYEKDAVLEDRIGREIKVGCMLAVASDDKYREGKMRMGIVTKINWRYSYYYSQREDEAKYAPSITLFNLKWKSNRTYYTPENMIVVSWHTLDLDKDVKHNV
jgi:hypothetical protein